MPNTIEEELRSKSPELLRLVQERDGAARLLEDLPKRFSPEEISNEGNQQRSWELVGLVYLNAQRWQEALLIFRLLYRHMLAAQKNSGRWVHKGMPLVWLSDCFYDLGYPVHAKRYLLLTFVKTPSGGRVRFPPAPLVLTSGSCGGGYRIVSFADTPPVSTNWPATTHKLACFRRHSFNASTMIG